MNRNTGFTLIELMFALAVASILLTVGVPSFREMISNNRITTQSNVLVGFLQNARMEAVRQSRTVTVCVDNNLGSDACDGSNWVDGWKVWVDLDSDSNVDANEILRVRDGISGDTTIAVSGFTSSISFGSTGEASSAGSFTVCDSDRTGERGVQISISSTGRISSGPPSPACS